mgnify:CR=1 FL=1
MRSKRIEICGIVLLVLLALILIVLSICDYYKGDIWDMQQINIVVKGKKGGIVASISIGKINIEGIGKTEVEAIGNLMIRLSVQFPNLVKIIRKWKEWYEILWDNKSRRKSC